ncbi:MAG: LysM peptidoglycan-binding domain-containing protein, partial [Bdellovibrio sp.]|nr:LysM peptidoglycan-binding domain-containing protein [Bdellovibrio sp.]
QTTYVVNARAPHLYMVSRDLYGSERQWKAIANWNSLKAPYDLRPGQELVIKKAPTLSTAEADALLISTWEKMDRKDIAQGIAQIQEAPAEAKVEAPLPEPEPAVAAPAAVAVLATPPPEPVEEAAAEPTPAPEEKPKAEVKAIEAKPVEEKATHHRHWSFKTSLVLSYFNLKGDNSELNVNNSLVSDLDYGIELEAAYHLSERSELLLGASLEKMDIHPPSNGDEVEGESQYLGRFMVGIEDQVSPRVTLAAYGIYEQTPFVEPTTDGVNVEAIYVPQLEVGARWKFVEKGNFKAWFITDGILLLPTSSHGFDLKTGGGWLAGFKFANQFSKQTLTYGVSYRDLRQDTDESKNSLNTVYGNIGLIW